MNEREVLERLTWDKFVALLEQWEARKALLEHRYTQFVPWNVYWAEHKRLTLALSKAEARLIELEAQQ